mmetsp:Transcript_8305/g.18121  ORF Transcript_8305/g.18121 Transcript_8305/m.18121 type:complete len:217 (+) Transcript_8305:2429-3079(+)
MDDDPPPPPCPAKRDREFSITSMRASGEAQACRKARRIGVNTATSSRRERGEECRLPLRDRRRCRHRDNSDATDDRIQETARRREDNGGATPATSPPTAVPKLDSSEASRFPPPKISHKRRRRTASRDPSYKELPRSPVVSPSDPASSKGEKMEVEGGDRPMPPPPMSTPSSSSRSSRTRRESLAGMGERMKDATDSLEVPMTEPPGLLRLIRGER